MFNGLTLRSVIIGGLIIAATALLSIAVSMQDHFLVFVSLMICIGLVVTLFRAKSDDDADEQRRH
jgi:uncharacterized membrane protein